MLHPHTHTHTHPSQLSALRAFEFGWWGSVIGAYLQSMLELEEPAMLAPSSFILTFVLTHAGGACYACTFILRPYLRPYPCWRSLLCLRLHPSSLPSEHAQTGGACYAWCTQARHQVGRGGVSAASPTPAPSEPETATQFVIVWVSVCVRVCVHLCLRAHMSVYVCTILYCI